MSRPANIDIHNLFQKFNGSTDAYQEIVRDQAEGKVSDWPIIAAMKKELPLAPRLKQSSGSTLAHTAPTRTLHPAEPATLFGALENQEISQQAVSSADKAINHSGDQDSLAMVFLRLLNTPQSKTDNSSRNILKNIFGRLNK